MQDASLCVPLLQYPVSGQSICMASLHAWDQFHSWLFGVVYDYVSVVTSRIRAGHVPLVAVVTPYPIWDESVVSLSLPGLYDGTRIAPRPDTTHTGNI